MTLDIHALSYRADGRLATAVKARVTGSFAPADDTSGRLANGRI